MISYAGHRKRLGIRRISRHGYAFAAFADVGADVAAKMSDLVEVLRAESTRVKGMIDSTWSLPGTKASASLALDTADKSIDYLDADGRTRVLTNDLSLADWTKLANGAVDLLNNTAKLIGKTSIARFSEDVLTSLPGAIAQVTKSVTGGIADIGGNILSKSGLKWPLIILAGVIGFGYFVGPRLMTARRS